MCGALDVGVRLVYKTDYMAPKTHIAKLSFVLLACAAGAGGGILADAFETPQPPPRAEGQRRTEAVALEEIVARLAALEARAAEPRAVTRTGGSEVADHADSVVEADPAATSGATVVAGDAPHTAPGAPPDPRKDGDLLAGVLGRAFGYREAETLFETLARDRGSIGDVIARLEKEIAANPRNADLHAALATAYGAKTAFDTPPGPEQGTVWEKAERAYDEAIRLDPGHWQARYGRAFGDSMAPEFVGLRPRAIRQFEELVQIQEKQPKAPEHVEVYLRLGTLLKDAGNVKKARETWQRGLDRFPEDKRLVDALALVEEK
jgi:tetratricopeptide (TPR) repeat protein